MDISNSNQQEPRTRNVTDETRRAELLAAYQASGLTQRAFARREGINYHTFISWLVQQRRIEATAGLHSMPAPSAGESSAGAAATRLEVSLPGEIVVRGDNPMDVATLVHSLRHGSPLFSTLRQNGTSA
jgi:hypothetical protein